MIIKSSSIKTFKHPIKKNFFITVFVEQQPPKKNFFSKYI